MSEAEQQITVYNGYGAPDTQAVVLVPRRHKMEAPKVSVIMAVYNAEKDLRATLDSVLAQTLKEIEIICVDDGSTDASVEILQEYAARDDRFIILTQQNHFAGVARNAGMTVARGEFLSFLDSDDIFKPSMLEDAYTAAMRDGTDLVAYGHYKCGETADEIIREDPIKEEFITKSPVCPKDIGKRWLSLSISTLWSKLFRRSAIAKHGLTMLSTRSSNDFTFACTMNALSERVSLLPDCYVYYRMGRVGNLTTRRNSHFHDFLQALTALKDNLHRYGVYRKMRIPFHHYAVVAFMFEQSYSQTDDERRKKLEKFEAVAGKSVGYMVRSWTPSLAKRAYYRLMSILYGYYTWG